MKTLETSRGSCQKVWSEGLVSTCSPQHCLFFLPDLARILVILVFLRGSHGWIGKWMNGSSLNASLLTQACHPPKTRSGTHSARRPSEMKIANTMESCGNIQTMHSDIYRYNQIISDI